MFPFPSKDSMAKAPAKPAMPKGKPAMKKPAAKKPAMPKKGGRGC